MRRRLLIPVTVVTAVSFGLALGDSPAPSAVAPQIVVGPAPRVQNASAEVEDPFPIRRVRATEDQLTTILNSSDANPSIRLPRSDFEDHVRAASLAARTLRPLPRITEAHYKASLVGEDIVGSAELEVMNPADDVAVLRLEPLRLALGPARWGDGRGAVLGLPASGSATSVWIDKLGTQTLKFDWSLAGISEPGEQRFELRVPPCPTSILELELPKGQLPTVSAADVLLTGPFPILRNPDHALWRFRFGGLPRLDFAVRSVRKTGLTAAAALRAIYDFSEGQVACAFEYDLRPAKGTTQEWEFDVDPELLVTNVEVNNRAAWTIDPPTGQNAPRRLRVALRQPSAGGKVLISALGPFLNPADTSSRHFPVVRPVGVNLDDETLSVRIAGELRTDSWNPGDYRLTNSVIRSDQFRELTLVGSFLPPGMNRTFRRQPAMRVSLREAEFTTEEQITWKLDSDRVSASVRMRIAVRRGPLFQFSLEGPPRYALSRVSTVPNDLLGSFESIGGTINVEFARPLASGQSMELLFEFRGPVAAANLQLPFPAFIPLKAAERTGVIGLVSSAVWTPSVQPGVGMSRVGWLELDSPLPPAGAWWSYRFRGSDPDGKVTLGTAHPVFTAERSAQVVPTQDGLEERTVLSLRVLRGGLSLVRIREYGSAIDRRAWRVLGGGNAVVSAVPLPLAILTGQFALSTSADTRDCIWLVRLAQPASGALLLETTARITSPQRSQTLKPGDHTFPELDVLGSATAKNISAPGPQSAMHLPTRQWQYQDLALVTTVFGREKVEVVFGGMIMAAGGGLLPFTLPPGAEVHEATVGERFIEPGILAAGGDVLRLPVTATPVRFEVRYRLPVESGRLIQAIRSPSPQLPGDKAEVRRWWRFGPDVLPEWPVQAWDRESAADLPERMGGIVRTGVSTVVWRSAMEEVRIASAAFAEVLGVALAAVIFALAWAAGRRRHGFFRFVTFGALLLLGSALFIGPPWWQRTAFLPTVVGLVAAGGMVIARGHRPRLPSTVAATIVACAVVHEPSTAQPALPATVIILPPDSMGRETVVAPKSLLDRLIDASNPSYPGVVVTGADYNATTNEAIARVSAKFTVHAFESNSVATLPLAEARLERVSVDGRPAFPAAPRLGIYSIQLSEKGRHEIEVDFAVPVTGTGTEREFRFGVPETPAAKVTANLPVSAKQTQITGRIGRQMAKTDTYVRLESDIGALRLVQVRWRDASGAAAVVKCREGCLWDITERGAELTACYLVRIEQGAVPSLSFELPAELDPFRVAVRSLDDAGVASLKDWTLGAESKGYRPLKLGFRMPITGPILVVLTLAPREVLNRQPVLRFPRVIGPTGETDAVYGLRANGVEIEELRRGGVIDFSPDALTRDFAVVTDLRLDPQTPIRVFRPTPGGTPVLRPTLRLAVEQPAVSLDTTWQVSQLKAHASGQVRWTAKEPVSLLEFNIGTLKLSEVRGPDVDQWVQNGARVHLWLKRPLSEGEINWCASIAKAGTPFNAITPRPLNARLLASVVRIIPTEGFGLQFVRDSGWTPDASTPERFHTTDPLTPPIRVYVVRVPPVLHEEEYGWLSPRAAAVPSRPPDATRVASATPVVKPPIDRTTIDGEELRESRWVARVSSAIAWCALLVLLAILQLRVPRSTWPEQFGIIGGLIGAAVAGMWWVGIAAWAVARLAWFAEELVHRQYRPV